MAAEIECDLCGERRATEICLAAECKRRHLCRECNERWHRHPRRSGHQTSSIASVGGIAESDRPDRDALEEFDARSVELESAACGGDPEQLCSQCGCRQCSERPKQALILMFCSSQCELCYSCYATFIRDRCQGDDPRSFACIKCNRPLVEVVSDFLEYLQLLTEQAEAVLKDDKLLRNFRASASECRQLLVSSAAFALQVRFKIQCVECNAQWKFSASVNGVLTCSRCENSPKFCPFCRALCADSDPPGMWHHDWCYFKLKKPIASIAKALRDNKINFDDSRLQHPAKCAAFDFNQTPNDVKRCLQDSTRCQVGLCDRHYREYLLRLARDEHVVLKDSFGERHGFWLFDIMLSG